MQWDLVSGLAGAAAGWAGQWFLIDKPIYRKLDSGASVSASASPAAPAATVPPSSSPSAAEVDLKAKLDDCSKTRTALQEEVERLKFELKEAKAAFSSAKTEIVSLRAAAPVQDDVRDDLELINGIGPVFERKLYDAGVFRFKQLSEMTSDAITAIIKPQNWQKVEPLEWIAEAKKRAQ